MAPPSCVSRGLLNQYIAGIAACMSILTSAASYAWITPILNYLQSPDSEIPVTAEQSSWIVSIIEIGDILSPLPAGILANYFGRKPVLLATGPVNIISWIVILAYPSVIVLGVARITQGLAMGSAFTVCPLYLGEIASDHTRGSITSLFFNSWWVGILIQYVLGSYLSFKNYIYFTLSLNIPFILLFFWQPETPYYYLMSAKEDKAYKSLKYFRDVPSDMLVDELDETKRTVAVSKKPGGIRDLLATPADRKAFIILIILSVVRICSGVGAITLYATQIFDAIPNLSIQPDTITIALGVVMLFGGCVSSFTSDTIGRRPLLLMSCVGSLISQFCTGTFYFLLSNTSLKVSVISWISPTLILVYSGLSTTGMFPVWVAYTSELFTSKTRGIASSLATICVTSFSFLVLIIYQPITSYIGLYANFYMYSIFCLMGSVYFYFHAPETKGKSFAQIREELPIVKSRASSSKQ